MARKEQYPPLGSNWVGQGLKLVLGFGNWEVAGDLRGETCKSGTGEAITQGAVLSSEGKEGAGPGWEERQNKDHLGFCCHAYLLPPS